MARKSKFTFEERLKMIKSVIEDKLSITVVVRKFNIGYTTLRVMLSKYRKYGEKALNDIGKHNHSYTVEFKQKVINEYLDGESITQLGIKYLLAPSVVKNWINQYNKGILKEYDPKGEIYSMRSPKLSKETKMNIAKECIENGKNYKDICIKYGVKYFNLYSWVIKYEKNQITKEINSATSEKEKYEILLKLKEKEIELLKAENEILKKNEEILQSLKKK